LIIDGFVSEYSNLRYPQIVISISYKEGKNESL